MDWKNIKVNIQPPKKTVRLSRKLYGMNATGGANFSYDAKAIMSKPPKIIIQIIRGDRHELAGMTID